MTSVGLSHKNNKLHISSEEQLYEDRVYELIGEHDVQEEAVMVPVTGPYKNLSGHTLQDMHRPLVGGLRIERVEDIYPTGACTYSFNAYWSSDRHWLTNSHCTREQGGVHPDDNYYQIFSESDSFIGNEAHDPEWWDCPFGVGDGDDKCRWSDAAVLSLPTDQDWDYGEIARTESGSAPGQGRGLIVFHSEDHRFVIVDEREDFFEGMSVSKMGQTSGWTFGEITSTCVDVRKSDPELIVLCQSRTDIHAEEMIFW